MSFVEKFKNRLSETKQQIINAVELVDAAEAESRLVVCLDCPHLIALTKQCKKCGCFMEAKTKLKSASCPIEKW
jgi:hypothetical protein